jgi:glycogen operon protein
VRDFWRTTDGTLPEFTERFAGSSDLYADDGRRPYASVNFVTAHDGFTLRDLVSYNGKHNEANGENNRDGTDDNRSWNCGAEGATSDPKVLELRRRQERNFLATLFLSQGIPMLQAGDELGWTKGGNNNSYCQDNDLSWWDWSHADPELFAFTAGLAAMRRKHAVFRRRRFFSGKVPTNGSLPDIVWLRPDGTPMTGMDWSHAWGHAFAAFLNGEAIPSTDDYGQPIVDDSFLCLFNGHQDPVLFRLPPSDYGELWTVVLDTRGTVVPDPSPRVPAGGSMGLLGRSMAVLTRPRTSTAHA